MKRATIFNVLVFGLMGVLMLGLANANDVKQNHLHTDPTPNLKESQWRLKMQGLYQTLAALLSDVSSDRRFQDPANKSRILKEAEKLSLLVHDLDKKGMSIPDSDPTLSIVASLLGRETKRAVAELKRGNRKYAQMILRAVPGYCIACHTRNSSGADFKKLPIEPNTDLSAFERGEFFTATRQFDRAQEQYRKIIQDPSDANAYSLNWDRAIQRSLAIAVRVKKDPDQAQEIIQTILKAQGAPLFMKQNAKAWAGSITDWKQEAHRQAATEEGLYAEALRLMVKARELQKYPMDRSADIFYLRASSVAHDLLQVSQGSRTAEGFYLEGLSYEVLTPVKTENLHELYYEACIRKSPNSLISESCYQRLEEATFLGYTGSSGVHIPEESRKKLSELKMLSQPVLNIPK